jgi:hypothetical protein
MQRRGIAAIMPLTEVGFDVKRSTGLLVDCGFSHALEGDSPCEWTVFVAT